MPQRHDNLIGRICAFDNLLASAKAALCGKRGKPGPAAFQAELEKHILDLEERLRDGRWFPGPYRSFEVREPKVRMISAASFADRVVHHAVCRVVAPIFERGFIADSYANRIGKGTHRAVNRYEHYRDRHRFVLRCDVFRYFPAIDHAILKADLRRRIVCEPTLEILDRIIDGANPQEPVNLLFSGDDLFSPLCRRRGLPIGNLTSQFFANVYLDGLDHFVKEALRAPYLRYVDDFALFHNDCDVLEDWRLSIVRYLEGRRLVLHPRKTVIMATEMPVRFLGYELRRGGWRRPAACVRCVSVIKPVLRTCRRQDDGYRRGSPTLPTPIPGVCAIPSFAAGCSIPPREPGLPPSVFCAAALGTTNRRTCVPRIATGTPPATGTTTTVSVLPARRNCRSRPLHGVAGCAQRRPGPSRRVQ